jgi:hypothetical protein
MINFIKDTNINTTNTEKILYDNELSKTLIRTNVALSGNVKIIIDSNENLYLNSIESHPDLQRIEYQKYPISELSNYQTDIFNFLNKGKIDPNLLYYIPNNTEISNTKSSLENEYEDIYLSGAQYVKSKL